MNEIKEYTKPEMEYILENANLTESEEEVFKLRAKGKSIVYIGIELGLSDRTVNNRIKHIRSKIHRIL